MNAHLFNRRLFFRRTINEPAWIERASSNILERCTLVNLCEIGARLTISDVYDLPKMIALHLTRGSTPGQQCRVIWQRDHEVGVEFLPKAPPEHTNALEKSANRETPARYSRAGWGSFDVGSSVPQFGQHRPPSGPRWYPRGQTRPLAIG
jgi:hypothetical protein